MVVQDLIDKLYGVKSYNLSNELISSVGTTATKLLNSNPQRMSFVMINLSANTIYLLPDNGVSSSKGIVLGANGGNASVDFKDDQQLPTLEWWVVASGASSNLLVLANYII